jgi:hypothetical protein
VEGASLSQPPELMPFNGDWNSYEEAIYSVFLHSVVHGGLTFHGSPIKAQFRPATRDKGFSFWHLISEAPDRANRNEDDRIPDLDRCARIRWISWCIGNAESDGFSWWENRRKSETHVVIWAEAHDFSVVLAKRQTRDGPRYYLLKTAYCLKQHRRATFAKERDEFLRSRND